MRFFVTILSLIILAQTALAATLSADVKTKTIPAGTRLKLELMESLSSYTSEGTAFAATTPDDRVSGSDVVLPMGTLIRGSIKKITPAERMSRDAVLYLDFDHVVTPNGRQLPLDAAVTGRTDLTYDGGIGGRTYKHALSDNWQGTKNIVLTATDWGNDTFENVGGGFVRIVTVPLAATGGIIGGGAYYTYNFFADMIKKGKEIYLPKGETIEVILQQAVDVPVM